MFSKKSASVCVVSSLCSALAMCVLLTGCGGANHYSEGTIGKFIQDFNSAAAKRDVGQLNIDDLGTHEIKGNGYTVVFNTNDNDDCAPETAIKVIGFSVDNESIHSEDYRTDATVSFFYAVDEKFTEGSVADSISTIIASEPQDIALVNGYMIKKVESSWSTSYILIKASEEDAQQFN